MRHLAIALVSLACIGCGCAIVIISLVNSAVPSGLQGWGLFLGFVLAGIGGFLFEDLS